MKIAILKYLCMAALMAASCSHNEESKPKDNQGTEEPVEKPDTPSGEVMPAWSEGNLDIHFINSGRGECTFYILPDGTTMVVDAGEIFPTDPTAQPQRPNSSTPAYKTFGTYIKHFLPASSGGKIDYMMLTHFHIDHMGEMSSSNAIHPEGGYQLVGVSGLFEEVPFRNLIDRGYPTYEEDSYTFPTSESESTQNYIKFAKYVTTKKGVTGERFQVGSETQFKLLGATKDTYDGKFRIFNHVGNGDGYYKGSNGEGFVDRRKPSTENGASCGFHLQYGKFDFIAAGDLVSVAQNFQAYYYRDYVSYLEGFKSNHHLSANSWGGQMQKYAFSPRVIVVQSFYEKQPDVDLLTSIFSGQFSSYNYTWEKDVYLTKSWDAKMEANKDLFSKVKAYGGHVVIRVAPGGGSFRVYMLKDTDFSYEIKSVSDEYICQ